MANFFFDGTASVTAAKADNVVITANPALFVGEAQSGANVVLTYSNGTTLTVTGTTLGDSATNLPGVSLANGTFATGASVGTAGTNSLFFNGTSAIATADLTATGAGAFTASSVHAIFGGVGRADANDGVDSIQIGGKGSFLVYGNAGADTIAQGTTGGGIATGGNAFDSTSQVTVFGGKNDLGVDSILLANTANAGAKFAIYGGEGTDSINIYNKNVGTTALANTTIFGGQGAADSTDLGDSIAFNGGGTVNIFANAGNDVVTLGGSDLDSTTVAVVYGGIGSDNITFTATTDVKAVVSVFGGENAVGLNGVNADSITVTNSGTTVIYGGTAAADANDNADIISYTGQGTATIYAAGGNDSVTINTGLGTLTADSTSTTTVFGGNGNDVLRVLNATNGTTGTQVLNGGAGNDTFAIGTADNTQNTGIVAAQTGVGTTITINQFEVGVDNIAINNGSTTVTTAATSVGVANVNNGLQAALDLASAAAGNIKAVTFNGDTYVVVSGGGSATTFTAADDLAIKLVGVTDTAAVAAAITLV